MKIGNTPSSYSSQDILKPLTIDDLHDKIPCEIGFKMVEALLEGGTPRDILSLARTCHFFQDIVGRSLSSRTVEQKVTREYTPKEGYLLYTSLNEYGKKVFLKYYESNIQRKIHFNVSWKTFEVNVMQAILTAKQSDANLESIAKVLPILAYLFFKNQKENLPRDSNESFLRTETPEKKKFYKSVSSFLKNENYRNGIEGYWVLTCPLLQDNWSELDNKKFSVLIKVTENALKEVEKNDDKAAKVNLLSFVANKIHLLKEAKDTFYMRKVLRIWTRSFLNYGLLEQDIPENVRTIFYEIRSHYADRIQIKKTEVLMDLEQQDNILVSIFLIQFYFFIYSHEILSRAYKKETLVQSIQEFSAKMAPKIKMGLLQSAVEYLLNCLNRKERKNLKKIYFQEATDLLKLMQKVCSDLSDFQVSNRLFKKALDVNARGRFLSIEQRQELEKLLNQNSGHLLRKRAY